MASTAFFHELRNVHELLRTGHQLQGLILRAVNDAQVLLLREALEESGCLYSVLDSDTDRGYVWTLFVTGSRSQLTACVEILLAD